MKDGSTNHLFNIAIKFRDYFTWIHGGWQKIFLFPISQM